MSSAEEVHIVACVASEEEDEVKESRKCDKPSNKRPWKRFVRRHGEREKEGESHGEHGKRNRIEKHRPGEKREKEEKGKIECKSVREFRVRKIRKLMRKQERMLANYMMWYMSLMWGPSQTAFHVRRKHDRSFHGKNPA